MQAAGTIHTDFERGFICAEVMHYDELHELGSEAAVKAAGKYRQEVRPRIAAIPLLKRLAVASSLLKYMCTVQGARGKGGVVICTQAFVSNATCVGVHGDFILAVAQNVC